MISIHTSLRYYYISNAPFSHPHKRLYLAFIFIKLKTRKKSSSYNEELPFVYFPYGLETKNAWEPGNYAWNVRDQEKYNNFGNQIRP